MNKKISKNKGFTLVELLVVVSIISLLSSIVFASLQSARAKARDARRNEDLVQIRNALALYASDNNGNLPGYDVPGGVVHYWSSPLMTGGYAWSNLQIALAPYISSLPVDPTNNTDYTHGYYYTNNFTNGWMTMYGPDYPEGTCKNHAIIMAMSTESGTTRHDCTLNAGAEQYPNEIVIQLN